MKLSLDLLKDAKFTNGETYSEWMNRLIHVRSDAPLFPNKRKGYTAPISTWHAEAIGKAQPDDFEYAKDRSMPVFPCVPMTFSKDLHKVLKNMLKIATRDNPRNYGSVIYWSGKEFCATDGFRLLTEKVSSEPTKLPAFSLPAESASFLAKHVKELSQWRLSEDGTCLNVSIPGVEMYFRTSAVKYPNYQNVLPTNPRYFSISEIPLMNDTLNQIAFVKANPKDEKGNRRNPSIKVETPAGWVHLNAHFALDAMKALPLAMWHCGKDTEEPLTLKQANATYILIPIMVPK